MRLKTKSLFLLFISLSTLGQGPLMRGLQDSRSAYLKDLLAEKSVWFFFKPNCPICHSQMKEFSCLKDLKKVYPVGFYGTEKELWRESKKLGLKKAGFKNVFYGDKEITNLLKLKGNASPQILFLDKQTKKRHHLGAIECSDILAFLTKSH